MAIDETDDLLFTEEELTDFAEAADGAVEESANRWKIMLVDDEPDVHHVTKLALEDFTYAQRQILFLNAYSGRDARALIQENPDTALILMDVVMETEQAGLDAVKFIREQIGNRLVRIVLRTGQPGQAPEDQVIVDYDINDYKAKTELTYQKLFTTIIASLRSYELITALESQRSENVELNIALRMLNRTLEQKVSTRTAELLQATEEAQIAKTIAETANASKSAFLANMNHELRTPLNAIIGYTRLVRRRASERLPEKELTNLDRVLASSDHLLGLINTILDISKIESGRMDVTPTRFTLGALIESCVHTIEPLVHQDHVRLVVRSESGNEMLHTDQEKIKQIILNLLSNAAKFTEEGEIRLVATCRDRQLQVTVEDTGIGIPPAEIDKIFERFHQIDTSMTRQFGGTGLGLSISLRLAQLLGGDLNVSSSIGKGSTFILSLPTHYTKAA